MKYPKMEWGTMEAVVNKLGGMEGVQRFLSGTSEVVTKIASSLLEAITTIEVAGVTSFVAKDKFREGKATDGVKIAWLGSNFENNFLGKTEQNVAPATLRIQKLKKDSLDTPIISELGDTAETTLAQLWELLKLQGSGQGGKLLVNGRANIAYIRDKNDLLSAVLAYCYADCGGGDVGAISGFHACIVHPWNEKTMKLR